MEHACGGGGIQCHLPAVFQPAEITELEQPAVNLVKLRLVLDFLNFDVQQMLQVQLIAETAEEGNIAPGGQGVFRRVWAWGAAETWAPKVDWG